MRRLQGAAEKEELFPGEEEVPEVTMELYEVNVVVDEGSSRMLSQIYTGLENQDSTLHLLTLKAICECKGKSS